MNTPEYTDPKTNPVFVILGATGGIGSAVCQRLADKGARLVIGARGEERLRDLAAQLDAQAFSLDATQAELVGQCLAHTLELYGRVDGVANCVGSLLLKPAHLTSDDEWAETLATNLTSAFYTVRSAARAMIKTGGSIVLSSSVVARVGMSNHEAIAASKAGVAGLVLSAAATYSARGIRVNCVAPGLVQTPLTARLTANETALKASQAMHPLGRVGQPSDVASAIEWLLDPAQSWVTGQVMSIDGGLSTVRARGVV